MHQGKIVLLRLKLWYVDFEYAQVIYIYVHKFMLGTYSW